MSIEALKLDIIQRLSYIKEESLVRKLEKMLTRIEMDARATQAEKDYENGDYQTLDEFTQEMKTWLKNRRSTK